MKKVIYSFKVTVEREVEESTTSKVKNKETGEMEEITKTKKVKKPTSHDVTIYQPSRRQVEDADMEFSIEMSKCIKKGILTKAMLAKKYSDSGGLLSEEDSQKLVRSYSELAEIQTNLSKLMSKKSKSKEDEESVTSLTEEFAEVRRAIVDLETTYQAVFNHTADTKAQNKTILWYLVNLTFSKGPDGVDRPLFQGEDYEDKLDSYYEKDENGDPIYDLAKEKLMAFVSFWYFSQNTTEEDFKKLEQDMDDGAV
jgi:hypothetical protein